MSNASSYTIPTWPTNSVTDITYHSTHSIFSIHIPIIHSHDPQCLANICTNSPYALCALSFPYRITNHTDCVTDKITHLKLPNFCTNNEFTHARPHSLANLRSVVLCGSPGGSL